MSGQEIEFKGTTFTLSVIHLGKRSLDELNELLMNKVAQAPQFFNCAPIVVNVAQASDDFDFSALKERIEGQDFVLVGVTACRDQQQKDAARAAGLAVMTSGGTAKASTKVIEQSKPSPALETPQAKPIESKVFRGQIRSGQQIYAQNCDLIIMGSVGNGAEVIADGNIHIYGTLRGRAIAGASGNKQSRIFCQNLQAELVSIAGEYMLNEQLGEHANQASCILIEDQKLQFSSLT